MKDTPLIIHREGPYILAPTHCEYSNLVYESSIGEEIIHPAICALCKICNFIPNTPETVLPSATERDAFQTYINYTNKKVSSSLLAQIQFLRKNDRIPLAILVSDELLNDILQSTIVDRSRIIAIKSLLLNKHHLICHIAGSPVYYSRKLTRSSIQVVGEIEWR